ncbi:MAG: FAD-dependent oxidoreductase [Chloroflexi bacterium]|nr:FAD-dependent oxidoreductase [Chloroflexota bacterium]
MEFYSKKIERVYEPDVLVCGLGPAGISAAVAAARMGALTMAVERCAFAGGNFTNAKVVGIIGAVNTITGALITGGITFEMLKRAAYRREDDYSRKPLCELFEENQDSVGQVYRPKTTQNHVRQVNSVRLLFDPEIFKHQADMLLTGSGVKLLYHTVIADTVMAEGHIKKVILANKDGLSCVKPKMVIDCTGDADISAMSGAPFEKADVVQPGTLMFTVGGLVFDDFQAFYDACRKAMAQAADCGEIGIYAGPSVGWVRPGMMNFNNTRLVFDATSAESVTEAEIRGREDVFRFFEVYKKYIGAFKDAYILDSGPYLGTRESRRIIGEYVLTLDDIVEGRRFDDAIALAGGIVDFHRLDKSGHSALQFVKPSDIPYRTLLPQKVDNLLVAGRCHSVTQMAAAVTRMGVTAMLMGEAAGRAAVLALNGGCTPSDVDVEQLRALLLKNEAILND